MKNTGRSTVRQVLLIAMLVASIGLVMLHNTTAGGQAQMHGPEDESKIQQGLQIAPVPLDLAGRNRALVGLGSYLVNAVGDCNGCHTQDSSPYLPGNNPFSGEPEQIDPATYLVGGTFFGPFGSRNLRPRPDTGLPAGLTLEQFVHVMRTGEDLKNIPPAPLLQVMPWPSYAKMTDRDLRAIYEYLSALPPHPGYPE